MKIKIIFFNVVVSIFICVYLFFCKTQCINLFEEHAKIAKNYRDSNFLNISIQNTFIWKIKKEDWQCQTDEMNVSIVFNRIGNVSAERYLKKNMQLKVKINAYSIVRGKKVNRLVQNWYYFSDEPFSEGTNYCEIWGKDTIEYGLGQVNRYDFEDTIIELSILQPDLVLSKANPKLRIVGKYDYAVLEHAPLICKIWQYGLIIVILMLIINLTIIGTFKNK